MSNDIIKIRVVQPEDYKEVVQFIIDYFYKDEPLNNAEPKVAPGERNEKDLLDRLKGGTSIMAVQETVEGEELVAVNIAYTKGPSSIEKYFECAEKEGNSKCGQISKILGLANRNADVFNRYGVDQILYLSMTCVKPTARGKNLGRSLMEELMKLGKSLGYKVLAADCTSYYSARVCEQLGMDRVNFIAYNDYLDENNKQIFNIPAPHMGMISFAIRL